jgi:integrase
MADTGKMRAMHDHGYAIDLFIGECARRGLTRATQIKYQEVLYEFADHMDRLGRAPWETTTNDCRTFLDGYLRPRPPRRWQMQPRPPVSESTLALYVTVLRRYHRFLEQEGIVDRGANPMDPIDRPRRKRPEDVDVVTTATSDVPRLFAACDGWDELLCIAFACYLGPRRRALAALRREDLDLERGIVRFKEKGGKVIWKPLPDELRVICEEAEEAGVWLGPRDYVVPNRRPTRSPQRSPKVVCTRSSSASLAEHASPPTPTLCARPSPSSSTTRTPAR